jgi:rRNA processing protein Krr1/Pno1
MSLEQEEIAYVFGRMGSTKDKLGRVSGTHIELRGSGLLIEGKSDRIEKAKKYVSILLAQRHGIVDVDPAEHPDDLTLMQIPTDCKGFVTGRNGATLRQIERESATLMTFCRTEKDNEPLAIFGTRRGRLYAQLKIMSIVEGKHEHWFAGEDGEKPDVNIIDADLADDDWGVSWLKLRSDMVGYALGRGGETRIKLEIASGCIIQYIGLWAAFAGNKAQQERGKTYLTWLLEQQNGHVVNPGQDRNDVKILWVPEDSVGYVTGVKAKTLRNLETKTGTFCFFDKSNLRNMGRKTKEEMLIFSWKKEQREAAAEEVYLIVDYHQRKTGGNQTVSEHPGGSRSKSDSRSRSRSNSKRSRGSRSRSGSKRSRSYSRSRSRSRSRSVAKKEN